MSSLPLVFLLTVVTVTVAVAAFCEFWHRHTTAFVVAAVVIAVVVAIVSSDTVLLLLLPPLFVNFAVSQGCFN